MGWLCLTILAFGTNECLPTFELLFELRFFNTGQLQTTHRKRKQLTFIMMCIFNVHVIFANCVKTSDIKSESETKRLLETMPKPIAHNKQTTAENDFS